MKYICSDSALTALADAIRSKTSTTEKLTLAQMAEKIKSIQTGIDIDKFVGTNHYGVKSVTTSVAEIRPYAFYEFYRLETVNAQNLTAIDEYAFYSCNYLKTCNLEKVKSIGENAFYGCNSFPNGGGWSNELFVGTKLASGDTLALSQGCLPISVKKITIGTTGAVISNLRLTAFSGGSFQTLDIYGLKSINLSDYVYISNFENLIIRDSPNSDGVAVLSSSTVRNSSIKFYVPASSLEAYKAATNWSSISNRIFSIESMS